MLRAWRPKEATSFPDKPGSSLPSLVPLPHYLFYEEEEPWPYSHDAFRIRCTVCTCAPQRALRIRLPAPGSFLWTGSLPCSPATGSSRGQFRLQRQNPTNVPPVLGLRSPEAEAVAHPYPAVPHAGRPLGQPLPAGRTPSSIRPALGTGGSVWRHPA